MIQQEQYKPTKKGPTVINIGKKDRACTESGKTVILF